MQIPYFAQETNYTCGAAVMRMALGAFSLTYSEKKLAQLLQTNRVAGTKNRAFPALAEELRLTYTVIREHTTLKDIQSLLTEGFIPIVCFYHDREEVHHYAIVKRLTKTHVILADPLDGDNHKLLRRQFMSAWSTQAKGRGVDTDTRWLFALKQS
jgi:ABC-type bacteriocin/lantibiotic exporter with double-glycine peptidase domain